MIEPGDGWKFTSQIADRGYFDDQVMQHVLTGHMCQRRVFSDSFCDDSVACGAVRRQLALSGGVIHPALPCYYMTEEVQGLLCIYGEYIVGQSLEELTLQKAYLRPSAWAARSLMIVRTLRSVQPLRACFRRLRLSDLVVVGDRLRIANRWPIGEPTAQELEQSAILNRLEETELGGVYVSEEPSLLSGEMRCIMNLLYQMATGQTKRTLDSNGADDSERAYRLQEVEKEIAEILLRLSQSERASGIKSLEQLEEAVAKLVRRSRVMVPVGGTVAMPGSVSADKGGGGQPAPVQEEPVQKEAAGGRRVGERSSVEAAKRLQEKGAEVVKEDAAEDRSFLYPQRREEEKVASPMLGMASSLAVRKQRRGFPWGVILRGVFVLAGVVAAGAIGYFVYDLIMASKPNEAPTAAIAPLPQTARVSQKIPLDGRPSSDPEGDDLRYTWSVPQLPTNAYYVEPNRTAAAATAEIQFFRSGTYEIQLEVFDGNSQSMPATARIVVRSGDL